MDKIAKPWKIWRGRDYTNDPEDTQILSIEDANGRVVLYTDSGYFKPREEVAILIEAAPDLLDALKEARDALKDIINAAGNGMPYSAEELCHEFIPVCDVIEKTIEKAGG